MATMDDPPPGDGPSNWDQQAEMDGLGETDLIRKTRCCDPQYWIDRYGSWAEWAHWMICGPLGFNITCTGAGGDPT